MVHAEDRVGSAAKSARERAWGAAAAVTALAALVLHASSYLPFLADDALITLRYAERLLDGHGLTWTDGERVEGYSNLLWLLLTALLGSLGVELIDAVRMLGVSASGAAIVALLSAQRSSRSSTALPVLAGGLFVALSGPIAVWTVGGLEQPLVAALLWALTALTWALSMTIRRSWRFVSLALAGLTILAGLVSFGIWKSGFGPDAAVAVDAVSLYKEPDGIPELDLEPGRLVGLAERSGEWVRITLGGGLTGWVPLRAMETVEGTLHGGEQSATAKR